MGTSFACIILAASFLTVEAVFSEVTVERCLYIPVRNSVECTNQVYTAASTLPKNITKLTWMFLNGNNISVLDKEYFSELSSLELLSLKKNFLSVIKRAAFGGLKNLKTLILSENYVSSLDADVFENCPVLETVDLSSNGISRLQSFATALKSLKDLKTVTLNKNVMILMIDTEDFRQLINSSLARLDLRYCNILFVRPGAFSFLSNLHYLDLFGNILTRDQLRNALVNVSAKLTKLDLSYLNLGDAFLPVESLKLLSRTEIRELIFDDNPVVEMIRSGDFPFLPKLLKLTMKKCNLLSLEDDAFRNLTALEELDLSENKLSGIVPAIYSTSTLRILDMSFNKPRSGLFILDEYNLRKMTVLEELYLKSVPIGPLKRYSLNGLISLRVLFLNNSIRSIESYAFETLENLSQLSLTKNYFSILHENTFFGLVGLEILWLQENEIVLNSTKNYFSHMPNLRELFLYDNQLTEIPYNDLKALKNLTRLLLHRNKIIPWTTSIYENKPKALQEFDLRYNILNIVTLAMIKDFENLMHLDLHGNPFNCSECENYEFARQVNETSAMPPLNDIQCVHPENMTGKLLRFIQLPEHCIDDVASKVIYWITGLSVLLFVFGVSIASGYYFRWFLRHRWFILRSKLRGNAALVKDDNYLYDAFISYNYKDGNWLTEHLLPQLEVGENPMKLCVHERDFEIGREILNNVIESIDRSRKIILLLSNDFLTSHWCMWEMNMAQFHLADGSRDALILILLGNLDKPNVTSTLRFLLRTQITLRWPENPYGQKLFFEKLKYYLQGRQPHNRENTVV